LRDTANANLEEGFGSRNGQHYLKSRTKVGKPNHFPVNRGKKCDLKSDYSFRSLLAAEIYLEHRVETFLPFVRPLPIYEPFELFLGEGSERIDHRLSLESTASA
jgi:hypothetical protein